MGGRNVRKKHDQNGTRGQNAGNSLARERFLCWFLVIICLSGFCTDRWLHSLPSLPSGFTSKAMRLGRARPDWRLAEKARRQYKEPLYLRESGAGMTAAVTMGLRPRPLVLGLSVCQP